MLARRAGGSALLLGVLLLGAALAGAGTAGTQLVLPPWPSGTATPTFTLRDTHGRNVALTDLRGTVVLLYFGFLSCPDLCPTTVRKLAQVRQGLGAAAARVRIVFVTVDPEQDTPQALDEYARALDPQMLTLTGTPAMIERAATAFGVQYARVSKAGATTIDHSGAVYILDASGALRLVAPADATPADLSHDLRMLTARPTPPAMGAAVAR